MLNGKKLVDTEEFPNLNISDGNCDVIIFEITNPSGTYDFEVPYVKDAP